MNKWLKRLRVVVVASARHEQELAKLRQRVAALEEHITRYGPDPRVGRPSWEEPYRPPHRPA